MTYPRPSARTHRRAARPLAALAAGAALLVGAAAPAAADGSATVDGPLDSHTLEVSGLHDGGAVYDGPAGLIGMTVDGEAAVGYCIDVAEDGVGENMPEVDAPPVGFDKVELILDNFHHGVGPVGYSLVGDEQAKAGAIQAAIWFVTNGFVLVEPAGGDVVTNYTTILEALDSGDLVNDDTVRTRIFGAHKKQPVVVVDTDKPGEDKPDEDKPGQDKPGQDKPGQDKPDQDKPDQSTSTVPLDTTTVPPSTAPSTMPSTTAFTKPAGNLPNTGSNATLPLVAGGLGLLLFGGGLVLGVRRMRSL